jgi:hypothetical protein
MHPLLERFSTPQAVRDVWSKGRRGEGLDVFEHALWVAAGREERVVEVLLASFQEDGDVFAGDTARDILCVAAAADLLLVDGRLGLTASALQAACRTTGLDDDETRGVLGLAVEEEAVALPSLPGAFDREWVREALTSLTRIVALGRAGVEKLAARCTHEMTGRARADRARVLGAVVDALFADGPSLLSRDLLGRAFEACGDEILEPSRELGHLRAFVELLFAEGVIGPRRRAWVMVALVDANEGSPRLAC